MSHGRSVVTAAGERSRRRAAEEAAKEIQTYYSGLRAATPLARSTAGLQGANEALSLPREVPDQAQFQSDSEPQGEEFEDAQGNQDSGNPEAGSVASEGAVGPIAARRQYEEAREVGIKGGVNARTRAEAEERQVERVIDRDQGSRSRQAEFDDRESLIPQVTVSSVQEGTGVKAVSAEAETISWKRRGFTRMPSKQPTRGTMRIGVESGRSLDQAVDLDQMQDLRRQIQELRDELARAKDPSKKKEKEGGKSEWNKKPKKKNPFRCFNCDEEGHIARNCQKEKKKETAVKPKKPEGEEPKAACAVIGGDQSSEMTNGDRQPTEEIWIVISPSLASRLKLKIIPWEGPMVVTADGQPMNPRGKVSLTVTNKNASVEGEALLKICFSNPPIVELGAIHMEASGGKEAVKKVTVTACVTVPKRSAVPVKVSIPEAGNEAIIGLSAGHALIDCSKPEAVVHVMNVDHVDHVICVASTLAAQDRNDLIDLLTQFQDVFADSGECLGQCYVLEHAIPTGGAAPIKQLPRRRAWRERELIKEEVSKMLKQGVIEQAQSPWSSPVVLVRKMDGKWRFCIDYRRLNEVTTKDVYPLPRIDDALSKLEGAALFSVVDLQSGYWQTAFVRVWPLPVPSDAVWVMLSSEHFPTTYGHGVGRIKVDRLFGELKLNIEKCAFGNKRVRMLGHVVSKAGIEPDPDHCKAIEMCPGPNLNANEKAKRKWVKSFVGLCSFYRKFVPNFAQVAYPLTTMEGKGVFRWGEPERNSFAELGGAYARKRRESHANLFREQSVEQIGEELHDNGKGVPRHCMGCKEVSAIHLGYKSGSENRPSCLVLADDQAGTQWPVGEVESGVTGIRHLHPLQKRKPCEAVAMDQTSDGQERGHAVWKFYAEGSCYPVCPELQKLPDAEAGSGKDEGSDGDHTARALPDATARQIAKFFVEDIVLRHGFPRELTSDQGTCFTAEVTREVLALLRLSHRMTVPYHQQANGLVERKNKTLATMLAMYVNESHEDWDEFLGFVTFAYNTAVIPADLLAATGPNQPKLVDAEDLMKAMMELREDVKDRLAIVQQRQKTQYDARASRKKGLAEKLLHQYVGPYKVVRQVTELNYELRKPSGKKTIIVHVSQMKKFVVESDDESDSEEESENKRAPGWMKNMMFFTLVCVVGQLVQGNEMKGKFVVTEGAVFHPFGTGRLRMGCHLRRAHQAGGAGN
ncbi:pol polyprotein [Daphnia sinensis]|uniref:Pol polyprotein n=1 Tax=Daphnia sinensis TaxID=1820382 RepID=A0AAD5LGF8_9CRUS|nr:pol polyprotein [Daphnia sinensis]